MTLAIPESLQPLFAAKVVEATTMALPEDDVEEIEPESRRWPGSSITTTTPSSWARASARASRPPSSSASCSRCPRSTTPAPIVLDAEALRSLATLDGWWEGVHRPAVLTPHSGEFARLRAGSGVDPATDGDLIADDTARATAARAAAATWARWSCSRAPAP